ncbi:hypothetical protein JMJ77_0012854 [Colletotrichum scovillei]|uniref:Uncharacterized protein n=1 Tax=Colletotrichum scovillei TaxID=1209932 RepID=A0A9P7R5X3_9PEZI|nr:hypothetical protein JMJ77_0012854 [Colletotrichum scovillei]KAG7069138.1 hypothetical protein JMJ76_0002814 [Colletotrichum scovillei]KAG7073090.1 hypothetical protein JMJ78_0014071 [Colletotrichum scovillei]
MYTQSLPIQYGNHKLLSKALANIVGDGNFTIHGFIDQQWYFQTSRLLSAAEIAVVKIKMKGHSSRQR